MYTSTSLPTVYPLYRYTAAKGLMKHKSAELQFSYCNRTMNRVTIVAITLKISMLQDDNYNNSCLLILTKGWSSYA